MDLVTPEDEGGGLALIAHRQRVRQPIGDVGAPE